MLAKTGLLCCAGLLAFSSILGASVSSLTSLVEDLEGRMIELHPRIASNDTTIRIANPLVFDGIPSTSATSTYNIGHVKSLIGRTIIPISYTNERGRIVYRLQAIVDIDVKGWFLKTHKKHYREQPFNKDDVQRVYETIRGKPSNSLKEWSELEGKEAAYTLSPGVFLTGEMVKTPALIKARDTIDAILKKSAVELVIKGKALEDGRRGDIIRVKLLVGRKSLVKGEVIDDHSVRILDYY